MTRWCKWSLASRRVLEATKNANAKLHLRLGKLSLILLITYCPWRPHARHTRAPSTSCAALREAQFLCKCVYVTVSPFICKIKKLCHSTYQHCHKRNTFTITVTVATPLAHSLSHPNVVGFVDAFARGKYSNELATTDCFHWPIMTHDLPKLCLCTYY